MPSASPEPPLKGRRITLAVTGSIAAYKAVFLLRSLLAAGAEVEVVMTQAAERFIGAATFSGLTGRPVHTTAFGPGASGELHVTLAKNCELLVIAPATADTLGRLASGRADDLLGALALCVRCPVLLAPAMHPHMWEHPATERNRALLAAHGNVHFVGPAEGVVASGDQGIGRMAEPEAIFARLSELMNRAVHRDLQGRHLVITAGPTLEALDPVRFLGNRSSGKLGFALAREAAARGAHVTLITGPVPRETPAGVVRVDIESAAELAARLDDALGPDLSGADAVVMAAAVADYRPASYSPKKRQKAELQELGLAENPDIIGGIGARRTGPRPLLVAFALESSRGSELVDAARDKLKRKHVDAIVANHTDAMGGDASAATLVTPSTVAEFAHQDKAGIARAVVDWVSERLGQGPP